ARIRRPFPLPYSGFGGIERIIGHHDAGNSGDAHYIVDVALEILGGEELPSIRERRSVRIQPKSSHDADDPTGGLRKRSIANEQGFPDRVRLLLFAAGPNLLRANCAVRPEHLGDEVMIRY